MQHKHFDFYSTSESTPLPDQKQLITYSYNKHERKITGTILEKEDLIYLYEWRGKYVGTEFFISFSKNSNAYKLIKVEDMV